ncbi:hypothetical protein FSARC_10179 [Fusarium sarcochroum]|uniref:Uncharacterized protein n=1 Tax=Fusarium sarcochroum TaxID=1208366 RepID=A0A8H4TP54_9HYPO|nr:hypothetical protein FSARC_10179 [Fusarium sarcochroum]
MWPPRPALTPPCVTFEDSDSDSDCDEIMPDYDGMSEVVSRLEKLAATQDYTPVEDDLSIEDDASTEYDASVEGNASIEDNTSIEDSIPTEDSTLVGNSTLTESTPPESPIEAFLPRPETPKGPVLYHPPSPNVILANGVVYSVGQLHAMSLSVAEARHNGEFPVTAEVTLDSNAVTEDFNALMYLRRLRGDLMVPASEEYIQFRDQTANRIRERHASLNDECKQETARRVQYYLQAVENEQRHYNATNNMLQHRGISNPTQQDLINVNDEMCSMVEHTIEQGISDATGPLRMNVGRLGAQAVNLGQQNEIFQQQNMAYEANLRRQSETLQDYLQRQSVLARQQAQYLQQQNGFFRRQTGALQQQTGALQQQAGAFEQQNRAMRQQLDLQNASLAHINHLVEPQIFNNQATAQNLAATDRLVSDLSSIATQIPEAIRKALDDAREKQEREIREAQEASEAAQRRQGATPKNEVGAQYPAVQAADVQKKNGMATGSDGVRKGGRSSLHRMVRKLQRRRLSRGY